MNKIQIFAAPSIKALQAEINGWLADHKDAHIVETNMTSRGGIGMGFGDKKEDEKDQGCRNCAQGFANRDTADGR
ncbi:hypothetical protein [Pedobacter heparinus]|uniref:hypothetical protein n=1 Tax=Pedobacter heparinus TaxID=984 RepID=UPI00292FD671|nr:hypothetical protein [Pedobacter heparinus]